jgi:ATP/maltotriose-dependent transcriptional regulator MalT
MVRLLTPRDYKQIAHNSAMGVVAELADEGLHEAKPVGRGAFGVVYSCWQTSLDRVVAVKILCSDPDDVDLERFDLEQRAMGRVSGHPNIVPVLQTGTTCTGRPYIVMPYYPRDTAGAWINRNGPIAVGEALTIGVRLAGALETAHRAGVLHGDVKPGNVLLTNYGEAQLGDFGIARLGGGSITAERGGWVGSVSYAAPELLRGDTPSVSSDIYGLAASIFTFLSGEPPYLPRCDESHAAFVERVLNDPIPNLQTQGVPGAVCVALEQGLNPDRTRRPNSALEYGTSLRAAAAEVGIAIADVPLESPATVVDVGMSSPTVGTRMPAAGRSPVTGGWSPGSSGRRRISTPPSPPTRFRPPTSNRPTVRRRRILDHLYSLPRAKLVYIQAPAGYGKSVLAAQWAQALDQTSAWLAVDSDDNNADWFIAHLLEAIRQAAPDLADMLQQEFDENFEKAHQHVVNALINYLHSHEKFLALVIDDWHRIDNADSMNVLAYLVESSCHHLNLIVTSRTRTGLPISTLRVQGELIEIDAASLKFDMAESQALLVDHWGLDLTEQNVAALRESTAGWVAALQLAALSLRDHADPATLAEAMSGRDEALGEYLTSNVLDGVEPETLDFLLATCLPEQLCAGLATALTDRQSSGSILDDIEKRGLFLRKADRKGVWFQYHHLFAEYLRARLERDAPGRVPELHRRAARWFSEQQMYSQAVDHLLWAGEIREAVDVVERAAPDLTEQWRANTLIGLAAKLPANHADARPRLQLDLAWANVAVQRMAAFQQALRLAETSIDALAIDDDGDLRAEIALARAIILAFDDRVDTAVDAVEACKRRSDTLPARILCVAAVLGSFRALRVLDFDEAMRWHHWGRQYHHRMSPTMSVSTGYCFAAIAANEQLDVAGAESLLRHACRIGLQPSGRPSFSARQAGALLGTLLYEFGQLDEPERLIEEAYERTPPGLVYFMLPSFVHGARIKLARGDAAAAYRRIAEGLDIARKLRLPRFEAQLLYEQVRLAALSAGKVDELLARQVQGHGAQHLDRNGDETAEFLEDAQIRLLLLDADPAAASAACRRARTRLDVVDPVRRPRAHLQATIQMALCLAAFGDGDQARRVLAPALETCAALGFRRLILDEGPQLVRLAQEAAADLEPYAEAGSARVHVRDFVFGLADAAPGHTTVGISRGEVSTPVTSPRMARPMLPGETVRPPQRDDEIGQHPRLTQREQDVLSAWCRTESKQEVAKQLCIEPSTVATHLQRIRAKYAAVGRPATTKAALAARAIQDGILTVEDL